MKRRHPTEAPRHRRSTWRDISALASVYQDNNLEAFEREPLGQSGDVLTRLHSYEPQNVASMKSSPHSYASGSRGLTGRARIRSVIAGTAALTCVGALVAGTMVPAGYALSSDEVSMAGVQQNMYTGGTSDVADVAVADSVSSLEEVSDQPEDDTSGLTDADSKLSNTELRYPFDSEVPLTDSFGYRTAPVAQFHDAQDMAPSAGTPIRIVGDGVVSEAGFASDGCGFSLSVEHEVDGQNVTSRYCHMQENSHSYQVGDAVKSGDEAGRVGETGMAFGAHLHFILRVENEAIDPLPFISKNSD